MIQVFKKIALLMICSVYSLQMLGQQDTLHFVEVELDSEFSLANITHINHDHLGNLWITTLEGLYRFDGYEFVKYTSNENEKYGLIKNETYRTHLSKDSTLWIAGMYMLYKYDPITKTLIRSSNNARTQFKDIYEVSYYDIEDINDDQLLIANKMGLYIYDKISEDIIQIDTLSQRVEVDNFSSNVHVVQMERDPIDDNIIWLLTRSGIYKYDCKQQRSKLIYYGPEVGFELLRDRGFSIVPKADRVYFLINYLSIFVYDRTTQKVSEIPQDFPPNTAHHIRNLLPDDEGIVIAYIAHGLQKYVEKEDKIKPIQLEFDVKPKIVSLSYTAFDHEGRYTYISNTKKILKSKEQRKVDKYSQKIFIKNLKVEGINIIDSFLPQEIQLLESYQRNLTFDIGLTARKLGKEETYFYKLDQDDWVPMQTNTIVLNDLRAGHHVIKAKIITSDKEHIEVVKTIQIKPYFYETTWFFLLLLLSLIGVGSSISYLINIRKKDRKAYEQKMLELEMHALRSQMNPHFIFNSINSIKNYVITKGKEEAADYLTQFAKLIRLILENSRKKYISIDQEVEMLRLYIEIEQKRLSQSFDFTIDIDENVDPYFLIPPMILQPYVENAIWHGLMNKSGEKHLNIKIDDHEMGLMVSIKDDGIGRKASQQLKANNRTSKKSLGLSITSDRISLIRQIYGIESSIEIIDLKDEDQNPSGTEVVIILPIINETKDYD